MAGLLLDGAGQAKMNTLDAAMVAIQRIHSTTEQYGLALKQRAPTGQFLSNIKRQLPSLAANLKNQFGMISDAVTALNVSISRGASEEVRIRTLREGIAQIKQALEIAVTQTKDKHAAGKNH